MHVASAEAAVTAAEDAAGHGGGGGGGGRGGGGGGGYADRYDRYATHGRVVQVDPIKPTFKRQNLSLETMI